MTVSSPVSNATTTNTLTLDAPTVAVNANVTIPSGEIDFGHAGGTGTSLTSGSGVTLSTTLVQVHSGYQTVNFSGPLLLSGNGLGYAPTAGSPVSFTANNSSNQIANLYLASAFAPSLTGDVDVRSSIGMTVADKLTTSGNITFLATGGDLTFGGGGPTLNAGGTMTLASTNGAFNDNGSLALGGAGRKLVYSSTDGGNFNVTGLGYTQLNPVSYPNDPDGSGNVIYLKTASGLPLLTITADDKSMVYGSSYPTYTASYSGGGASDLTSAVQFQFSGAHSNAGSYSIVPYGATSSTHRLSFLNGTLTITRAALTIAANDASRLYGGTTPAFSATFSGLVNGETSSVVSGLTFSTPATSGSPVGQYAITPSGATASNYTITYTSGTLDVTPAPLTIAANDVSRLYGGTTPAFSATFSGLVNGDTSSVVSGLTFSTAATSGSPVGPYAITPSGATASNYTVTFANGTLDVTPAPLTITANDVSRLYGGTTPAFSATFSGLVNGDTSSVVSGLTFSTAATSASPVGHYAIAPSGVTTSNYAVTFANGTLDVTPAPLTITANDVSRLYGGTTPAFSATFSGLVNGDTSSVVSGLTFSTTATSSSPVGQYAITPSGVTTSNYTVTFANGTLDVTPAPLRITANDVSRLYGGTTPAFSATFSGLVNGDTSSVVSGLALSTAATSGSPVGRYAITPSGATAPNYTVTFANGTLDVTPAPIFLAADDQTRYLAAPNPRLTFAVNGLVNGDTAPDVVTGVTLSTKATQDSQHGTYPITLSGGTLLTSNYTIAGRTDGTLKVLNVTDPNNPPAVATQTHTIPNTQTRTLITGTVTVQKDLLKTPQEPDDTGGLTNKTRVYTLDDPFGNSQESNEVIQEFIDSDVNKNSHPPMTSDEVYQALESSGARHDAMLAALGPLVYSDLETLLNGNHSKWTGDQKAFVAAVTSFIEAQRKAAAQKAQSDYQAWKDAESLKIQEKLKGLSGARVSRGVCRPVE